MCSTSNVFFYSCFCFISDVIFSVVFASIFRYLGLTLRQVHSQIFIFFIFFFIFFIYSTLPGINTPSKYTVNLALVRINRSVCIVSALKGVVSNPESKTGSLPHSPMY